MQDLSDVRRRQLRRGAGHRDGDGEDGWSDQGEDRRVNKGVVELEGSKKLPDVRSDVEKCYIGWYVLIHVDCKPVLATHPVDFLLKYTRYGM